MEEFGNTNVVKHVTDPVENAKVRETEGVEGLGEPVENEFLGDNEMVYHVSAGTRIKFFIERSDSGYVMSESTRKRKRSDQDDVSCGYALIGSQSKRRRLNDEEVGGKDILDYVS
uniref:Uncharacterized protein n=1 Tax=Tanacetum cinerariifolium TaxID=118510 RepID=A0A6L2J9J9_TANCI|nr:hypothetical protein [Tanacetum cinerariifolium]